MSSVRSKKYRNIEKIRFGSIFQESSRVSLYNVCQLQVYTALKVIRYLIKWMKFPGTDSNLFNYFIKFFDQKNWINMFYLILLLIK